MKRKFTRFFSNEKQDRLRAEPLFLNKLMPDIEVGQVFPAIRDGEIHFYHRGGRLFAYDGSRFRTNLKYVLALHDESDLEGDVIEADLAQIHPIRNFEEAYRRIKELCALYAEWEASAVSNLYETAPYTALSADPRESTVVLDIETSFSAESQQSEDRKQDRIDLVLLDTIELELLFVEAKLFANAAIRASAGKKPKVVDQIDRYRAQILRPEICDEYRKYIECVNRLFHISLRPPVRVIAAVPLLVVDFDADQRDGRLAENVGCLRDEHKVCCLSIGGTEAASASTLAKWCKTVRQFVKDSSAEKGS